MGSEERPLDDQIVDILFAEEAFENKPLTEQILADRLGKGRSQIRDALNRLEAEELVERRKKKGVYLSKPSPKVIAELYDLRILLEGYAARQAAQGASPDEIEALKSCALEFERAAETRDFREMERQNTIFHLSLVDLSKNDFLIRMIGRMNIIRKAFRYAYGLEPQHQRVGSQCPHGKIVEALIDGDADKAESLIRNHIQIGKERVLEQALGFQMKSV